MARNTFGYAVLLIIIGFLGYYLTGTSSYTALIPAGIGAFFLAAGLMALLRKDWNKHIMHGTMVGSLLVLLMMIVMITLRAPKDVAPLAMLSQLSVLILTTIYLILGVKSFIDARRTVQQSEGGTPLK